MTTPSQPNRLLTRQELYDRVRASGSKDEVIVEEMVRLGFWELGKLPDDPADELLRIAELERKIRALATETTRLGNTAAMKAELHKRRLAAAREKRAETRRKRADERLARAKAWENRKKAEILYLGEGVSHALRPSVPGEGTSQLKPGLPDLPDAAAIAKAMGVPVGRLRFLAFHRPVSTVTHYRRFTVPKKTGGTRLISAPMPRLKAAQRWILENIFEKVPLHDAAHGFVAGRSIVTNAAAHVGRKVVVNCDLKDFFPTLTFPRVLGVFRSLGYSPQAATILALLCTEPEVEQLEIDGRRWYVHASERRLPQGSPCSPAITNLVCVRLDQRLTGLAKKLGYTYTRYADDLTFSGDGANAHTLLAAVRAIVSDEGFAVHPDKTRIQHRGRRQEVTGLVVNDRVGVDRRFLRRWRAVMFQVAKEGPAGKSFGHSPDVVASLLGFAAFVRMVDTERGAAMLTEAKALAGKAGWTPAKRPPPKPKPAPPSEGGAAAGAASSPGAAAPADAPAAAAPAPDAPKRRWWEVWKWFT